MGLTNPATEYQTADATTVSSLSPNWVTTRLTENPGHSVAPAVAGSGSNVYIVWSDDSYGNSEIVWKKSTDNGATWITTRLTSNTGKSEAPAVAVSGSDVHIVWQDESYVANYPEIVWKKTTDGGSTWVTTRVTNNSGRSEAPTISASGSEVHMVWHDDSYALNYPEVVWKKSTDGGTTWVTTRMTSNSGKSLMPVIK